MSTIAQILQAYRQGASPTPYIRSGLDQVEADDRATNAFLATCRTDALRAADNLERSAGAGAVTPLRGVPFAVKDLIDVEGMVTTGNSHALTGGNASVSAD